MTLYRKASRLNSEYTRQHRSIPRQPDGEIRTDHVFHVVKGALTQVREVKKKLGILEPVQPESWDGTKTASDVFSAIIQLNHQLNLLLDHPFSPRDVYQQVTLAISHISRLLATFPEAAGFIDTPPLEKGKQSFDVYRLLIN